MITPTDKAHELFINGFLSQIQYKVLQLLLVQERGASYDELAQLWLNGDVSNAAINKVIARLRWRLRLFPAIKIITVRGHGFRAEGETK